jgi:hypothetical protein
VGGLPAAAVTGGLRGFPAALTSFIGREEAVRDVAGLLDQYRLVTLARVLAGQQLLLVLDNCEHVIGAAAQLCARLLAACDEVRVLATSREPLAAAGEARYRLGPLTLPSPGDPAGGERSEAVALFADRARRADPRFALEAAEALAGDGAEAVVLRLVDCSLLSPPRAGPDGRSRYVMLETLRAYGAGLLAEAGEQDGAAAALAGYALRVAEEPALALRLAGALAWWWFLRGRLAGVYRLLRQAAGGAEAGSDGWCAAQLWLGRAAQYSADPAGALGHFTAVRDAVAGRPPSRALTAALTGRAAALRLMGRTAEAAGDARRALALARQIGDPARELLALADLSFDADSAGAHDEAVRLARQAGEITTGIPGRLARLCSYVLTTVLADAGDLAEAARVGAAGLARARDAGDLYN